MEFSIRNWSLFQAMLMENYAEDDERNIFDDPYVRWSLILAYTFVFLLCFFGNLLVVLVTTFHSRMQSVTKFSLGNLAVANFCVGIFCIYQNLSLYILHGWVFGGFMCKMYHFVNSLSYTASILILVVNAAERYLVIVHPFRCRRLLTKRRLRFTIIGVWLISGAICSPRIYYMHLLRREIRLHPADTKPTSYLICTPFSNMFDVKSSDNANLILMYLLPLAIITTLYTKLGFHLWAQERVRLLMAPDRQDSAGSIEEGTVSKISSGSDVVPQGPQSKSRPRGILKNKNRGKKSELVHTNNNFQEGKPHQNKLSSFHGPELRKPRRQLTLVKSLNSSLCSKANVVTRKQNKSVKFKKERAQRLQEYKSIIRMLVMIVVTFAVCNFPYHLRKLYQNYASDPDLESDFSELLTPLTFLFMYTNCALNPFIYGFMSKTFRACILEFLKCKFSRKNQRKTNEV